MTIQAFGMLVNQPSSSLGSYTIDGISSPLLAPPTSSDSYPMYNFKLLTDNMIPSSSGSEPHTLVITAAEPTAFFLDYILLETGNAFVTSFDSDRSGSSGGGSGASPDTLSGGSGNSGGGGSTPIGAIVGGVVGGVVVLAAIGLAILFCLRRRRGRGPRPITFDMAAEEMYVSDKLQDGYEGNHGTAVVKGIGPMRQRIYSRKFLSRIIRSALLCSFLPLIHHDFILLDETFSENPFLDPSPFDPSGTVSNPNTFHATSSIIPVRDGYDNSNAGGNRTVAGSSSNALSLQLQSRKLDNYAHTPPSNSGLSPIRARRGTRTGGSVIVESDSGLRGFEEDNEVRKESVRLPPRYTPN